HVSEVLRQNFLSIRRNNFGITFIQHLIEGQVDAPRILEELSFRIPGNTSFRFLICVFYPQSFHHVKHDLPVYIIKRFFNIHKSCKCLFVFPNPFLNDYLLGQYCFPYSHIPSELELIFRQLLFYFTFNTFEYKACDNKLMIRYSSHFFVAIFFGMGIIRIFTQLTSFIPQSFIELFSHNSIYFVIFFRFVFFVYFVMFSSYTGFLDILSIFSLHNFVHIAFLRCYLLFPTRGLYLPKNFFTILYASSLLHVFMRILILIHISSKYFSFASLNFLIIRFLSTLELSCPSILFELLYFLFSSIMLTIFIVIHSFFAAIMLLCPGVFIAVLVIVFFILSSLPSFFNILEFFNNCTISVFTIFPLIFSSLRFLICHCTIFLPIFTRFSFKFKFAFHHY
ncbi:hypothetical protein AGLY_013411, partial [Aphis glycines]